MAKEYIEREALITQLNHRLDSLRAQYGYYDAYTDGFDEAVERVEDTAPAADVVEVKHGEWIESFSFGYWHYDCPFCDDGYAVKERDETKPNYCQNCGAKMDGERKEQG